MFYLFLASPTFCTLFCFLTIFLKIRWDDDEGSDAEQGGGGKKKSPGIGLEALKLPTSGPKAWYYLIIMIFQKLAYRNDLKTASLYQGIYPIRPLFCLMCIGADVRAKLYQFMK